MTDKIFDERGELRCCPRCGGSVAILGYQLDNTVTMFECVGGAPPPHGKPCGRGDAVKDRKRKGWTVYWENDQPAQMGWFISDGRSNQPWGEDSPW
jgi:hypothetical protein